MGAEQIISSFWQMITPDMYLVVAAVYAICYALKKLKAFDSRFIPLTALLLGVGFELLMAAAFTRGAVVDGVLKGLVCGMAAVFVANIVKQIKSGKKDTDAGKATDQK